MKAGGGFGFLDGHGPVAGEDHLDGGGGFGGAGAEGEGVDVAEDLGDGLGGDEPLCRIRRHARRRCRATYGHRCSQIGSYVGGMFAFGIEAAAMEELDLGSTVWLRGATPGVEVAERGGGRRCGAVQLIMLRMVSGTAVVSGTLASSIPLTRELLNAGATFGVSLVVAVVILGTDRDQSHGDFVGGEQGGLGEEAQGQQNGGSGARWRENSWSKSFQKVGHVMGP